MSNVKRDAYLAKLATQKEARKKATRALWWTMLGVVIGSAGATLSIWYGFSPYKEGIEVIRGGIGGLMSLIGKVFG